MSAEQDKEPIALKRVRGNRAGSGGIGERGPTGKPPGRPGPKCAAPGARGPHFVCRRAAFSIPSYPAPLLLPTTQHNRHLGVKKRHPRTIPTPPRKLSCTARELRRLEEAPPSKRQHIFTIFSFSLGRETRYIQKAFSLLTNKIKNQIIQKSAFCIIGFLPWELVGNSNASYCLGKNQRKGCTEQKALHGSLKHIHTTKCHLGMCGCPPALISSSGWVSKSESLKVCSLCNYLLTMYYVLGTVLGTG